MVIHAGQAIYHVRAGIGIPDGSKPSALRGFVMSVDVVPINGFAAVFEAQPNKVVAKVRVPLFSEDILINDGSPDVESSLMSTFDILDFVIVEEISPHHRIHG